MKYLLLVIALAGCLATPTETIEETEPEGTQQTLSFSGPTMAVFDVASDCEVNWFAETKGGSPYGVILIENEESYAWEMVHQQGPSNNMVGLYTATTGGNVPGILFHVSAFNGTASLFFRGNGDMNIVSECDANVSLVDQKPLATFLDHTRASRLETAGIHNALIQWDVPGNAFIFAATDDSLQTGGSEFVLDIGGNQLISTQMTSAPVRGTLATNIALGDWSGSDGGFWLASY